MVFYVIFGYKLNKNNKIHPILKKRLDLFISKYKKGDKVILSGGNTNKNTHTQAYIMSKYIRKHIDINKNHILLENKSLDTTENVIFSFKIFKKQHIQKITIISSIWHLNRIKKIIDYVSERRMNIKYVGSEKINPENKKELRLIKKEIKLMEKDTLFK
tara:strand:+ start:284 stop:760 length:477 start_codon:yes stop_codon:yes gene_type:complete